MERLQQWMSKRGETDTSLAQKVTETGHPISRVQITRIRNGKSGASKPTAQKLEEITGIPWHEFIEPVTIQ